MGAAFVHLVSHSCCSFVKDLCIHSPASLTRKNCSKLAEMVTVNLSAEIHPISACRFGLITKDPLTDPYLFSFSTRTVAITVLGQLYRVFVQLCRLQQEVLYPETLLLTYLHLSLHKLFL